MKAVLISTQSKWVEKIANRKKTIEVRKTAPKQVPFKAFIYCTKDKYEWLYRVDNNGYGKPQSWHGKVIGEFVCDKVFLLHPYTYDGGNADLRHRKLIQTFEGSSKENEILAATCLTQDEMFDYIGAGNYGYGWHISDLKIYDKPKELNEFRKPCKINLPMCDRCEYYSTWNGRCENITRAPQGWCYVEEL